MTASEIRALFAVASRPGVISLSGGLPCLTALPMDTVANSVADMLPAQGLKAPQYGSGQGDPTLREQILWVRALEERIVALAPHAIREKLVLASESAILCPSACAQMTVSTYLASCDGMAQIKVYRELELLETFGPYDATGRGAGPSTGVESPLPTSRDALHAISCPPARPTWSSRGRTPGSPSS